MKRLLVTLCVLGLGTALAFADEPRPSSADGISALLEKGPLLDVRKPLERLFTFSLEGSQLKIDRTRWVSAAKETEKVDSSITRVSKVSGDQYLPEEKLFLQLSLGPAAGAGSCGLTADREGRRVYIHSAGDVVRMTLQEGSGPNRVLIFGDDGQGALSIQLSSSSGSLILLGQERNGRCKVVAVFGDRLFSNNEESFLACLRKHRLEMETLVLPTLEQFGIEPFRSPRAPKVRQAVLALLARSHKILTEGRRLLDDLNGNDFTARDKAQHELSRRFEVFEDLICQKMQEKPSLELRKRLEQILQDHADALLTWQTITALALLQDAAYLLSMLDDAKPEDAARLIAQLEKITGQKLGADPAAWKEWVRKNLGH